jgi:hypothetical protein
MSLPDLLLQSLRDNYAGATTGVHITIAIAALGLLYLAKRSLS